jgi:hypothetical protein
VKIKKLRIIWGSVLGRKGEVRERKIEGSSVEELRNKKKRS